MAVQQFDTSADTAFKALLASLTPIPCPLFKIIPGEREAAALHAIPCPSGYNEWRGLLCAAKASGVPYEEAKAWSQTEQSYNASQFAQTWKSLNAIGGITAKSLYFAATAAGWIDDHPQAPFGVAIDEDKLDAEIEAISAKKKAASSALEAQFDSWPSAPDSHAYLVKKKLPGLLDVRVVPVTATLTNDEGKLLDRVGWLAVPARTLDGAFCTAQFISPDGNKISAPGAGFGTGLYRVGVVSASGQKPFSKQPTRIIVCEGLATGAALFDADADAAVLVAFGSGRLKTVAKAAAEHWPMPVIVVADRGAEKEAMRAALAVGGRVVPMPQDAPSGFDAWDFHRAHGHMELRALIDAAQAPSAVELMTATEPSAEPATAPTAAPITAQTLPTSAPPPMKEAPPSVSPPTLGSLLEEPLPEQVGAKLEPTTTALYDALGGLPYRFAFDAFRDCPMVIRRQDGARRPLGDEDYTHVARALEAAGFKRPPKELLRDVIRTRAKDCSYDSALEWLKTLPTHDGVSRVDGFLTAYCGVPDSPYARAVSMYLWSALAGRVLQPGIKADMAPVLTGPQGIGKSSIVAAIAPFGDWFAEIDLHDRDNNLSRLLRGRVVCEMAELAGLSKKDTESVKSFLTRRDEVWVPKYLELATTFKRRCILVGTTNASEFLVDETGNRRWLPVTVGQCRADRVEHDRDQLWAEARDLFNQHGILWKEAQTLATAEHEKYMVCDPWEEPISAWLKNAHHTHPSGFTTGDVATILGLETQTINSGHSRRVSAVLTKLGYSQKRVTAKKERRWFPKG